MYTKTIDIVFIFDQKNMDIFKITIKGGWGKDGSYKVRIEGLYIG